MNLLQAIVNGWPTFRAGETVTVSRPIEGRHLVDRGMLSTEVRVPLVPGDALEYRGKHLRESEVVRIPEAAAHGYLARVPKEQHPELVERSAFFLYLPAGELKRNDG